MSIRTTLLRAASTIGLMAAAALSPAMMPGLSAAQAAETTLIHAGTVLAIPGERPKTEQTIIIRDGKVAEMRDGYTDPAAVGAADARVVDLKTGFVLPGLIDSHVHIMSELGPLSRVERFELDREDIVLNGALFAERTLQAGFTTVRDLGSPSRSPFALRDAIEAGKVPGPTIVAAGRMLSITAGHGDINGLNEELTEALHDMHAENVCDGVDDCRRAVREQVRNGADVIKLATTGGVLSNIAAGTGQQMFDDEIRAIVETSKLMGKKVAAHAHGTAGINAALRAGVDSVEHGSYLDDESVKLFRQSGAWLVPTLLAGATVVKLSDNSPTLTDAQKQKAREVGTIMQINFGKAIRAGVRVAFGTDSGVSPHGTNAEEFALMVKAGMAPADAIQAATVNAATLLGREDRVGTLEPGKDADIIAVSGNPLEDVTALRTVDFVMRRGVIHRQGGERQTFVPKS
ncbi:MAG: hypothetical protein RLY86_2552 [Pseudomonadota bacterium]|jgi:imidazolonepropionase-like amidohydrolase